MGTIEWILGFVAIAALWLFLRAFKKGVRLLGAVLPRTRRRLNPLQLLKVLMSLCPKWLLATLGLRYFFSGRGAVRLSTNLFNRSRPNLVPPSRRIFRSAWREKTAPSISAG